MITGEQFLRTVPRQERSRQRLEAILDAFGVLLGRGGMEALSITAVAQQAEIPSASIYDYVSDTRSLLGCFVGRFFDRNFERTSAVITVANDPAAVRQTLRLAFAEYVERYRSEPGLFAAMALVDSDPDLARMHLDDSHRTARGIEALLAPFVAKADRARLARSCLLGAHLAGSAARAIVLSPEDESEWLTDCYIDLFTAAIPSLDTGI